MTAMLTVLRAVVCLALVALSVPASAQKHLEAEMNQAVRDLKVIDPDSLTAAERKDYDGVLALVRAARQSAAALGAGSAAMAEQAQRQVARLLDRLLKIEAERDRAERYLSGGVTDALLNEAAERATADMERLAGLVDANRARLGRPGTALAGFTARLVAANVLLHTSVGIRDRDGIDHLQYAHRVLGFLEDAWLPSGFRRAWYLAALAHVEGRLEVFDAVSLADEAVALFPVDADVLVAAGVFDEALASTALQLPPLDARAAWGSPVEVTQGPPRTGAAQRAIAELWKRKRSGLARAERLYRQAIARQPGHLEGHLRLGRVLCLTGRLDEAIAELQIAGKSGDHGVSYLAWLFTGDAYERLGEWNRAVEAYTRARGLCPACLSGGVALSYAIRRSGHLEQAADPLNSVLGSRQPVRADDPWWYYPLGDFLQRQQMIEDLRQSIRQ